MKPIPNKTMRRKRSAAPNTASMESLLPPDLTNLSRGEVISQYHKIKKQLAMVDKSPLFPNEAARQVRREVLRAHLKLIGIDNYQHASREGEALGGGFDSSQWVIQEMQHGKHNLLERERPLRVLDVGSIAHRFPEELEVSTGKQKKVVPLHVTSIDLNPEDSEAGKRVIKADFFDFAKTAISESGPHYDVVCLSLCVNFEGSANRRGLMIHLASQLLVENGLLFLVLPRACIENSRYLDEERFHGILNATGMKALSTTYTSKLMQSISNRTGEDRDVDLNEWKRFAQKEILRNGDARNNFAICLDPSLLKEEQGHEVVTKPLRAADRKLAVLRGNGQKKRRRAKKLDSRIEKRASTSNQRKKARRERKKRKHLSQSGETSF